MNYPGGKGKCYQRLINLIPPHSTYIETHLGSGAVLRHLRPSDRSFGIDLDERVIEFWKTHYSGLCTLVQGDGVEFLEQYQFDGDEFVYADPPYLAETRRRSRIYRHEYDKNDHISLLSTLLSLPCNVMISGYDSDLYRDALAGWRTVSFDAKTHSGVRQEWVWLNFDSPASLHDGSHLGFNFQERQSIKRRRHRIMQKIDSMSSIERSYLLEVLNTTYGRGVQES